MFKFVLPGNPDMRWNVTVRQGINRKPSEESQELCRERPPAISLTSQFGFPTCCNENMGF